MPLDVRQISVVALLVLVGAGLVFVLLPLAATAEWFSHPALVLLR
jgi:hypothetical protein